MKNNMFFKKEKSSKIWYLLCFLAIIITFFCYFFWQEKYYSFYCEKWANCNKTVICAGLIGTYQRTIFDVVSKLIPRSEYIFIKNAICKDTGKTASFSERLIKSNNNEVLIGGIETYKPVDRKTFFNDMSNEYYKEFIFNEIIEFSKQFNVDVEKNEFVYYPICGGEKENGLYIFYKAIV